MVREKQVEPILVDAVCALAARFSDSPIFTQGKNNGVLDRSDFGSFYAQRAKAATVETFPCPSVAAVQAYLLMAYEGFGVNQHSALWMYLGLAIRMAVDLGLQKVVGVKYQGEKDPWYARNWNRGAGTATEEEAGPEPETAGGSSLGDLSPTEQQEVEQERIDTFWAVFTLDRVISSGTGRPVTFKDDDFELSLPTPLIDATSDWPDPYPHFVRIIHLYGRVSDVLNNVRNANDMSSDKWKKLAEMETELTKQHQALDQRLEFNAGNFRTYVNTGQGTTFILLHFWFHALIIILHQPTLLAPFGGLSRTHQLLPNSRELSLSSAKTIADILSFAELIDPRSFIGNPFTSQPMYIAAYLQGVNVSAIEVSQENQEGSNTSNKHSLLASAANKNYQRCYNSLTQLHTYWGGVKYILTALDQKSEGIWDVETYTSEEYESTKIMRRGSVNRFPTLGTPVSPNAPPFAWSLAGTSNSHNSNLTFMYQNPPRQSSKMQQSQAASGVNSADTPPGSMVYDPIRQSVPQTPAMFPPPYPQPTTSAIRQSPHPGKPRRKLSAPAVPILKTPTKGMRHFEGRHLPPDDITTPPPSVDQTPKMNVLGPVHGYHGGNMQYMPSNNSHVPNVITFNSQDIDINSLGLQNEMMPSWLEYLPVMNIFDGSSMGDNSGQEGGP
ncbi:unnamed protein product [Parascedosporium putredinis]|uniref:Xylanolytic transcriptional activator regulatory domain-containing protein n=1 Tax=Parascedosporium putredinis TaxID=1442378 RepID=A0A9P1H7E2_9PEZI|nr:unnamed protein product [Parascedosporium putredinis]CAI7999760.1 unnamed protein product [Parascedosporium putredinis]